MKLRFLRKQQEADNISSFFFEPIDKIEWIAGQSIRLELPKPTWGVDERRFTIASAPYEKHIRITTRISDSSFKQSLNKLKEGDEIKGFNIEGDFIWGDEDKPRLFIAGGIGVTPFRSLLAQAAHEHKQLKATLIYSSKVVPALFQDELDVWQAKDPSFYVHYLVGTRLSIDKHSSLASFWLENIIYVSGPEAMVDEIRTTLIKDGVPEGQIRTDRFTGNL